MQGERVIGRCVLRNLPATVSVETLRESLDHLISDDGEKPPLVKSSFHICYIFSGHNDSSSSGTSGTTELHVFPSAALVEVLVPHHAVAHLSEPDVKILSRRMINRLAGRIDGCHCGGGVDKGEEVDQPSASASALMTVEHLNPYMLPWETIKKMDAIDMKGCNIGGKKSAVATSYKDRPHYQRFLQQLQLNAAENSGEADADESDAGAHLKKDVKSSALANHETTSNCDDDFDEDIYLASKKRCAAMLADLLLAHAAQRGASRTERRRERRRPMPLSDYDDASMPFLTMDNKLEEAINARRLKAELAAAAKAKAALKHGGVRRDYSSSDEGDRARKGSKATARLKRAAEEQRKGGKSGREVVALRAKEDAASSDKRTAERPLTLRQEKRQNHQERLQRLQNKNKAAERREDEARSSQHSPTSKHDDNSGNSKSFSPRTTGEEDELHVKKKRDRGDRRSKRKQDAMRAQNDHQASSPSPDPEKEKGREAHQDPRSPHGGGGGGDDVRGKRERHRNKNQHKGPPAPCCIEVEGKGGDSNEQQQNHGRRSHHASPLTPAGGDGKETVATRTSAWAAAVVPPPSVKNTSGNQDDNNKSGNNNNNKKSSKDDRRAKNSNYNEKDGDGNVDGKKHWQQKQSAAAGQMKQPNDDGVPKPPPLSKYNKPRLVKREAYNINGGGGM